MDATTAANKDLSKFLDFIPEPISTVARAELQGETQEGSAAAVTVAQ
jgi:hypothetical protein